MISGKSKEQCTLALRAAFGNPDRAFEYLMSGVNLQALVGAGSAGAGGAGAGAGAGGAEGFPEGGDDMGDDYGDEEGSADFGGAGGNPFAALASNPNFAMIRQRILQDPAFYQQFMTQL